MQVVVDLDQGLLDLPLPCLTLQPLVENACNHGLEYSEAGGLISITARRTGSDMEISVTDNGPGFPDEALRRLNGFFRGEPSGLQEETAHRAGDSIGLRNVHRRLQLYFSGNYGLDIASRPGCSRVTMTLPAVGLQFREGVAAL
jgi:sensor histidine kinase YesM